MERATDHRQTSLPPTNHPIKLGPLLWSSRKIPEVPVKIFLCYRLFLRHARRALH